MKKAVATALVLSVMLLVVAGCGGQQSYQSPTPPASSGGGGSSTGGGGDAAAASANVAIANFAFDPATVTVKVGGKVTWKNDDSAPHQVYSDDGSIKGPEMQQGASFDYTFAKAGTFPYYCSLHKNMKGTVVVK